MKAARFWLLHAWLPAALYAVCIGGIAAFDLDRRLADAFFFDQARGAWIGAGSWWATDLIHGGGAILVRLVALSALALWVTCRIVPRWRAFRAGAGYVLLVLVLCSGTVGGLKELTGVDCPRELAQYGGDRPYAPLLSRTAAAGPQGHCFPGSHASTAFALVAFYFAPLRRRPGVARAALVAALALGAVFSVGQEARGAHFLSHDLTSAAFAWFLALVLWYRLLELAPPLAPRWIPPGSGVQQTASSIPRETGPFSGAAAHSAHARRG